MRNMLYEREIRAEGFQQGREEGRIEGRTEGLQQGRTEGLQQGRAEGFQQGRNETMNNILELMRIHGFSPEEINAVKAAALKIVTGES